MTLFGPPECVEFTIRVGYWHGEDTILTQLEAKDPITGQLLVMESRPGRRRRSLGPELARTLNRLMQLVAEFEGGTPPPPSSSAPTDAGAAAESRYGSPR